MEILIGAGGWGYFHVEGLGSLEAYSRAFDFVEVNSTFYEYPSLEVVEGWRRRAPNDFQFSVKCHRDLTHRFKMEPVEGSFRCFDRMTEICKTLRTDMLLLETTRDFEFSDRKVESIDEFLRSLDLKDLRLIWEVRSRPLPNRLAYLFREHGITSCVDLSVEAPFVKSDMLYSRLFGKGRHNRYQFDDDELVAIDRRTEGSYRRQVLSFHGVKMYSDAARFKVYRETGSLPRATKSTGIASLAEVLREDANFPASKQELIGDQGWKVIDISENKRAHASILLEKLPDRTYYSVLEVLAEAAGYF